MNKKEKRIEIENALLGKVYDLILNPEVFDDERSILVEFKNAVGNEEDFKDELIKLMDALSALALHKFKYKKNLSKEISKFYTDTSGTELLKNNLDKGIAMAALGFVPR